MVRILVGTGSWTDKSRIEAGTFYPEKNMSAEGRLRHYATRVPIVEADSTCYAKPSARRSHRRAERTPDVFDVKSFRLCSGHRTQPNVLPRSILEALPTDFVAMGSNLYYKDRQAEIADE